MMFYLPIAAVAEGVDALLQLGVAALVVVVVGIFVHYLSRRDERERQEREDGRKVLDALRKAVDQNTKVLEQVVRRDGGGGRGVR